MDIVKAEESRPYFEKKRELEELERFRQILSAKIASENIGLSLPNSTSVEIVDRALPPLSAISPDRNRAPAMIALGFLFELLGLWMLTARQRVKLVPQAA